jgi:hypothetical protein
MLPEADQTIVVVQADGTSTVINVDESNTVVVQDARTDVITAATQGPAGPLGPEGPQGAQGPQGPQGATGAQGDPGVSDARYQQSFQPTTLVTVNHNLGKFPAVTVYDSAGDEVEGSVHYMDVNTLTVSFAAAFSGTVILN